MHQFKQSFFDGLLVDNFAGGGGASTSIELALGRPVDIAINHDPAAVSMHKANHPATLHYCESVWDIDPCKVTSGRSVSLAWFSPDCKHFSKAKGSTPVNKNIRGLSWVILRWAIDVRPRVIMMENVEEIKTWGPLITDSQGVDRPDPERKGQTFKAFIKMLTNGIDPNDPAFLEACEFLEISPDSEKAQRLVRGLGYKVDYRELKACDYGAPTIRKRFFLVARCDGNPIAWPEPTHGDPKSAAVKSKKLKPWRPAAEIIDWSIPCPSIFERKKPLAENTMRRIARGLQKFVFDNPKPFIVPIGYGERVGQKPRVNSIDDPLSTIVSSCKQYLVMPIITQYHSYSDDARGQSMDKPLLTLDASNRYSLVCAFISKYYDGTYKGAGSGLQEPLHTITGKDHNALVTSHLIKLRNHNIGQPVTDPLHTITAGGLHLGEVRAFLIKYYGQGIGQELTEPLHTITSKDTFGLVTIHGDQYQIVDIGMRMLEPHELFAAQGFPSDYIIDKGADGKPYPKSQQVAKCGNSVSPPPAEALIRANLSDIAKKGKRKTMEQVYAAM